MSYKVLVFTKGGVLVADGAIAAANFVVSARSGEAVVFVINTAQDYIPAVEMIKNMNDAAQMSSYIFAADINSITRELLASVTGAIAATGASAFGPAAALTADQAASEVFKYI